MYMGAIVISQADFLRSGGAVEKNGEVFEGDIGFDYKALVDFKAIKISDSQVYINGKVKGYFVLECSRCLEKYRHDFEIKINSDMEFFNGIIDLGEEVRQLLSLEIPMKPLCDKDCLGICAVCGKKHNKRGDASGDASVRAASSVMSSAEASEKDSVKDLGKDSKNSGKALGEVSDEASGEVCSCLKDEENFIKERWKELLTGGSKYAKSKKKTHASPQR
jgi:uncharacterized protein